MTIEKVYNEVHTLKEDVAILKTNFTSLGNKFDDMKSSTIKWVVGLFIGTALLMTAVGSLVMTAVMITSQ